MHTPNDRRALPDPRLVAALLLPLIGACEAPALGRSLDPGVLGVVLSVYAFIATCSAVTLLHPRLRRPEARTIRQAVNTWWAPALVCGPTVLIGAPAGIGLFAALSAWTLHEYMGLLPAEDRHPVTDTLTYAAVPIHYAALAFGGPTLFFAAVTAWIGMALPLAHAFLRGPKGMLGAVPRLQLGVLLCVLGLSHVARIFQLPAGVGPAGGPGLAALLLLCVMANDAAQYVSGKLFGRHTLSPVLSPKKTWEGLIGGALVTGLVAAAISSRLSPFHPALSALIGIGISVFGLLGDLLISAVKRDAGVKDTGSVLPGQGGILDRCDSLLLTAPLFAHALLWWSR